MIILLALVALYIFVLYHVFQHEKTHGIVKKVVNRPCWNNSKISRSPRPKRSK